MAPPAGTERELARAVTAPLAAVAAAARAGLVQNLGRDPMPYPGRHLIAPVTLMPPRVVTGLEAEWWVCGFADAHGRHDLHDNVPPDPDLITQEEAAARLGKSIDTVQSWSSGARTGPRARVGRRLEVVYFPARLRRFFAAQVAHLADPDDEAARQAWETIRDAYGLGNRIHITDEQLPEPGAPLSLDPLQPERFRAIAAARIAEAQGWTLYRRPDVAADGERLVLRFELGTVVRLVPEHGVLPYVLGLADAHGPDAARLVAYREGLI